MTGWKGIYRCKFCKTTHKFYGGLTFFTFGILYYRHMSEKEEATWQDQSDAEEYAVNAAGKGKEDSKMKIAVTYENGNVFPHFGHTKQFKIYEIQDGKVTGTQVIDTEGSGHGALAGLLSGLKVDTLICGGIGAGAQTALAEREIRLYGGVSGSTDEAVDALLAGELSYDSDVHCDHHADSHHHAGGHHCGEDKHGCGGNGGGCR